MVEHTRTLDFKIAFAIGLGTMIAAGIFSLSGTAVARIGSSAVIAFVLAAIIAGITAGAYSEFASVYSENGGGYLFTSRTFGDRDLLTYAIGMSLFLGYTGTTAFYLATMDEWVVRFVLPESLHFLPHGTFGVLTAILLGVLNARGTEESGTFQLLVTGAKVAVLLAFIGGAVAFAGPTAAVGTFTTRFSTDVISIVSVAALAFITFFGFFGDRRERRGDHRTTENGSQGDRCLDGDGHDTLCARDRRDGQLASTRRGGRPPG